MRGSAPGFQKWGVRTPRPPVGDAPEYNTTCMLETSGERSNKIIMSACKHRMNAKVTVSCMHRPTTATAPDIPNSSVSAPTQFCYSFLYFVLHKSSRPANVQRISVIKPSQNIPIVKRSFPRKRRFGSDTACPWVDRGRQSIVRRRQLRSA